MSTLRQSSSAPTSPLRVLVWAALGVVFGDIGTSPLYAMSETVASHLLVQQGHQDKVTMRLGQYYGPEEVLGWTSLFLWALLLVVTLKYVVLILRADNKGEGGMFAILAQLKAKAERLFTARTLAVVVTLAVLGSGLILGDAVITPSLTILTAWEGLEVVTHRWSPYVPWLSVATLVALFSFQRLGTAKVGALFAPAMAVWFAVLAVMGVVNLAQHPEVLAAINPWYAARYLVRFPRAGLFVIGSVDLCITGCEALFADMGHFGRQAVRRAWYFVVWPALVLNYLGQGARMLDPAPITDGNIFFALVPSTPLFVYPLVLLSWMASVIASQALISGAFSLVNQAVQLGLFPRVRVVHTNPNVEGQIYLPAVNWTYLALCVLLVAGFRDSHKLAPAYGLAVTGTMAFTTVLFYLLATRVWRWSAAWLGPVCLGLLAIDISFFASNATQFFQGGYITLALALGTTLAMTTWQAGRSALARVIQGAMIPIDLFLASIREQRPPRVNGTAVFLTSNAGGIPHSLLHYFKHARSLHRQVLLLTVRTTPVPEVREEERLAEIHSLGEGLHWLSVDYGYRENPNIPAVMRLARHRGLEIDPGNVSYFLGRESIVCTGNSGLSNWRKLLFKVLSQNAMPASAFFNLPPGRVVELGIQVEI